MTTTRSDTVRVLVWGENRHEQVEPHVAKIYPDRMHTTIAEGIRENLGAAATVTTTTLDQLMGTTCTLRWRSEADRELVWTVNPTHPIAQGVPHPIVIDAQEMYGEQFDIPVRPRQDLLLLAR
jgi:trehalose utilization protein